MPKTKIPQIFRLIPDFPLDPLILPFNTGFDNTKKQKPHKLFTCKALSIFGVTQLGLEPRTPSLKGMCSTS